ncbi:MAG: hypothetical protein U0893_06530 [Chloroflexota bacterium]
MADQRGTDTGAAAAAPAGDATAASSRSSGAVAPPARKAPDELLCTICGLKACWTKPEDTAGAQAQPAPSAT